ncbi:hypothetical protein LEMLEM_LOCUS3892, partial [Lemmus lemmus]
MPAKKKWLIPDVLSQPPVSRLDGRRGNVLQGPHCITLAGLGLLVFLSGFSCMLRLQLAPQNRLLLN